MTPVAVMGSKKLPPLSILDNNNSEVNLPAPSSLLLQASLSPPPVTGQEDSQEITTTNITEQDIVVKELINDDNKELTELGSQPKKVKTG